MVGRVCVLCVIVGGAGLILRTGTDTKISNYTHRTQQRRGLLGLGSLRVSCVLFLVEFRIYRPGHYHHKLPRILKIKIS